MAKKKPISREQQRTLRTQQIVMGVIGVLVILSMVISLFMK
jgi:predicted nucleic acid-binding Zn ribbon protein